MPKYLLVTLALLTVLPSHANQFIPDVDGQATLQDRRVRYTTDLNTLSPKDGLTVTTSTNSSEAIKPTAQETTVKKLEAIQPVNPIDLKSTWVIKKGMTLSEGLNQWLKKAGWNYLAWQSKKEYPIVVDIYLHDTFENAISTVLKAYHRSGESLYGCLKQGNRVVVISDIPLNDKCYSNKEVSKEGNL